MLPVIFEAFEQGGADRRSSQGGLGLGLAISRGITEMHGGRLEVSSGGPGLGAEFTLSLPLGAAEDRQTSLKFGGAWTGRNRSQKILLV